jgi:L-seryl-tRNA(Ser) seleniumtransferase
MRQSGARLVEVGTTNRTYAGDYEAAVTPQTAAIMRAHRSNFALDGFVYEPDLCRLTELAHRHGLLMLDDLGSGAVLDTAEFGMAHEPTLQESLVAGVDLVCASTDKLLGGPQGGVILGRSDLIERLERFPLTRALRVDKTTLAALQATLRSYLAGRATEEVPVWRMIALSVQELQAKAEEWADRLGTQGIVAMVVDAYSTVGGGSLPGQKLPTRALALQTRSADALASELRAARPPVVARIQEGMVLLDPRTIHPVLKERPELEESFLRALEAAWKKVEGSTQS